MLNNFIVSLEAVLPMFILMVIGYFIKEKKLLLPAELKKLNHVIFVVFFPVLMFHNLYGADIKDAFDPKLIAFGVTAVMVVYFASMTVTFAVEKNPKSRGAMIQGLYRSNFVIMGIPIAVNMFGQGNLGVTAMMVAVIVPLYNIMAVITLEVFRGSRPNPVNVVKKVASNPLILGAAAGIATVLLDIQLPSMLEKLADDMSAVATPMALVVLGASIDFSAVKKSSRNLMIVVVGRLVVIPAFGLCAASLLGFRGIAFVTLIAMFAAPTAVSSFTMAESMDSDGQLAGSIVIFTTAFACFTMFLWIFLFKNLGMF